MRVIRTTAAVVRLISFAVQSLHAGFLSNSIQNNAISPIFINIDERSRKMKTFRCVIAFVVLLVSVAFNGQVAYGCGEKAMNGSAGKFMPFCGRGGFKRSSDQDFSGWGGQHKGQGHHGWGNWGSKGNTNQEQQGDSEDVQAAINAVKEAFATQRTDLQKQLGDAKTEMREGLKASVDGFVDDLLSLVKEAKWTEIGDTVNDFIAERKQIRTDSKTKIDGIKDQIAGLKEQEAQAIAAIKEQFAEQDGDTETPDDNGTPDDDGDSEIPGTYDYGDFASSTLTTKAWDALEDNDLNAVEAYTGKTIELYKDTALEQQASLSGFASSDDAGDYWALNDVATSYFILAQAQAKAGNTAEAKENYQYIITNLKYAQAWDTQGWYWKVAEGAQTALDALD